jgi:hypothetical protein
LVVLDGEQGPTDGAPHVEGERVGRRIFLAVPDKLQSARAGLQVPALGGQWPSGAPMLEVDETAEQRVFRVVLLNPPP